MDTIKVKLAAMDEKLSSKVEVRAVEENVVAKVELVQQQLNKQEESNRQLRADNADMKKSLSAIMKQLERMTQQMSHDGRAEKTRRQIAMVIKPNAAIAGGRSKIGMLNSVEMFSLTNGTTTTLTQMKECQ